MSKDLIEEEHKIAKELIVLKEAKMQFLIQKAKCEWLLKGDENSAYFHSVIKKRRRGTIINIITIVLYLHKSVKRYKV